MNTIASRKANASNVLIRQHLLQYLSDFGGGTLFGLESSIQGNPDKVFDKVVLRKPEWEETICLYLIQEGEDAEQTFKDLYVGEVFERGLAETYDIGKNDDQDTLYGQICQEGSDEEDVFVIYLVLSGGTTVTVPSSTFWESVMSTEIMNNGDGYKLRDREGKPTYYCVLARDED